MSSIEDLMRLIDDSRPDDDEFFTIRETLSQDDPPPLKISENTSRKMGAKSSFDKRVGIGSRGAQQRANSRRRINAICKKSR